jgi:hypothetical protein
MYEPVRAVVVKPTDGRPPFAGWMLSARCSGVRVADGKLKLRRVVGGLVAYWTRLK